MGRLLCKRMLLLPECAGGVFAWRMDTPLHRYAGIIRTIIPIAAVYRRAAADPVCTDIIVSADISVITGYAA